MVVGKENNKCKRLKKFRRDDMKDSEHVKKNYVLCIKKAQKLKKRTSSHIT